METVVGKSALSSQNLSQFPMSHQVLKIKKELETIFDSINAGIMLIDKDYRICRVNRKMLDYMAKDSFSDVIGKYCFHKIKRRQKVCPKCVAMTALKTKTIAFDREIRSFADKRKRVVDIFAIPVNIDVGTEERHVLVSIFDVSLKDKFVRQMEEQLQIFKEDISKLEDEKIVLERRFTQLERMAVIGKFASGLVHEISNPLDKILGKVDLLMTKCHQGEMFDDVLKELSEIKLQVHKIGHLTRNLIGFGEKPSEYLTPLNINSVLHSVVEIATEEMKLNHSNIGVNCGLSSDPLIVMGNSTSLERCFLNIIRNAAESLEDGGVIHIESNRHPDKNLAQIIIRDNGKGIPKQIIDRIFDPFFSTKSEQSKLGLGLSLCKEIISHHNGTLKVNSEVGVGTTFIISLPLLTSYQ